METKQQTEKGRVQSKPAPPAGDSTGRAGNVTNSTPPAHESTGRTVPGQRGTRREDEGSPWPSDDTQRAAEYQRRQAEWRTADYQRWKAEWKKSPARPQEIVHKEWEDIMMKRTRLIKKMSTTAFSNMCAIINANEGQTPALQPREPTVHPDIGTPEDQRTEAAAQHRQLPVTRKKMPEHQKAESTSQPRRMNEGPKRASVTVSGERRGGMPRYGQALTNGQKQPRRDRPPEKASQTRRPKTTQKQPTNTAQLEEEEGSRSGQSDRQRGRWGRQQRASQEEQEATGRKQPEGDLASAAMHQEGLHYHKEEDAKAQEGRGFSPAQAEE
jgi:hypothetical protein